MVATSPAAVSFGRELVFTARVQNSAPIRQATLWIQTGWEQPKPYAAEITAADGCSLRARRDLQAEPVFPFSEVRYWWEIQPAEGEPYSSESQTLAYADDRFSWKRVEKGRAAVAWVEGESRSAEDAADLALLTLGTASADLEAPIPDHVGIYIYPSLADFQSALGSGIRGWEGGVSDPAGGIILIAAASGAEGRQSLAVLLPHEVVHLLLGAEWQTAYAALPLWLAEGVAAGYEMESRPGADQSLRTAARSGGLIPIQALCRVFPAEQQPALLAYAESKSFVAFVKERFGPAAIRLGLSDYAQGADCAGGLKTPTGKTVGELEADWVTSIAAGESHFPAAWAAVIVGIALLAGVLAAGMLIRRGIIRVRGFGRQPDGR